MTERTAKNRLPWGILGLMLILYIGYMHWSMLPFIRRLGYIYGIVISVFLIYKIAQKGEQDLNYMIALSPMIWGLGHILSGYIFMWFGPHFFWTVNGIITELLTNLLLFIGIMEGYIKTTFFWNRFQRVFDVAIIGSIVLIVALNMMIRSHWFVFDLLWMKLLTGTFILLAIGSIIISFALLFEIPINRMSLRQILVFIFIAGPILYSIVYGNEDWSYASKRYIYLEQARVFSYMCLAIAFNIVNKDSFGVKKESYRYYRSKNIIFQKTFFLCVISLIPVYIYMQGKLSGETLMWIYLLIVIYHVMNRYIYQSINTEILLIKEQMSKDELKEQLIERNKALENLNKELEHTMYLDTTTNLYNRRYIMWEISKKIKNKKAFAIVDWDMDRFSYVNETYGHVIGDILIASLGKKFQKIKKSKAQIARFGDDEFALIIETEDIETVRSYCECIRKELNHKIQVKDYEFELEASIGVTFYPKDAVTVEGILKTVDAALNVSKKSLEKNTYTFYEPKMEETTHRINLLNNRLNQLVYDDEFEIFYQPQYELDSKKLIGAEALIRWKDPKEGYIPPAEFIPLAEKQGVIVPISWWIYERVLKDISSWRANNFPEVKIGINLSPVLVDTREFFEKLDKLIKKYNVDPNQLDMEITETVAMRSPLDTAKFFKKLSHKGIHLSLDDFGTGYSSLSYIKHFHVDSLKIAKELVDNIHLNQNDIAIVRAIVMMAKGMGIKTIAEGVELNSQACILEEMGCDQVQGFLFAKPMPESEFREILIKSRHSS